MIIFRFAIAAILKASMSASYRVAPIDARLYNSTSVLAFNDHLLALPTSLAAVALTTATAFAAAPALALLEQDSLAPAASLYPKYVKQQS